MSDLTIKAVMENAIQSAFIKYPQGDGGSNVDNHWIQPEQSSHIAKIIVLELEAAGFAIVKTARQNT